jgi:two-component system, sensor histidine kinase and response regulator
MTTKGPVIPNLLRNLAVTECNGLNAFVLVAPAQAGFVIHTGRHCGAPSRFGEYFVDSLRILVVDDEPGIRLAIQRTLRDHKIRLPALDGEVGFNVELAGTGEEALQRIEGFKPDILLLDQKLPSMSGLEVLNELAGKGHDMITVMITAYASIETAITATKRGAFDFVAKPFTPDELTAAVYKSAKHLMLERRARQLAQEKHQLRFQLISMVSHELKAPLAAILGYLAVLRDPSVAAKPVYHQIIERSVARLHGMEKLIKDLLDLTAIESGQKKREPLDLDLFEIARGALDTVRREADERKVALELHGTPPLNVTADRDELEIILNNLLTNAIKYNRDGGRVDVELEIRGKDALIRVADTGMGLTTEEAEQLFGEFVRIRNEKTRHILGSGLGLSIIKKIVSLYAGDVTVSSRPNLGSTFTITLPIAR